ncbi:hypothetical protein DPMN_133991 [Dreissena polymorpha]|uniref:Uncharacterized protein n=1 Tax=Dreissena polymorpha TaxID=45954 RepID=A0A9D4JDF2_DREPO|nr:hypothetical protein DPMN_133991 [Dreissena polymorpha]
MQAVVWSKSNRFPDSAHCLCGKVVQSNEQSLHNQSEPSITDTLTALMMLCREGCQQLSDDQHQRLSGNIRVISGFSKLLSEKIRGPTIFRKDCTGGHVFSLIWTIFELVQDINKTNVFANFHDDWAKIVTFFNLNQDIIGTNVATKFHEDRTKNVASRLFTIKCGWMTDGKTMDQDQSQKLT